MVLFLAGVAAPMLRTSRTLMGQESDPIFVGAWDIGNCDGGGDEDTSSLVKSIHGEVFTTGDNAHPNGTKTDFADCYDPTWGQFKARTKPSAGNHGYDVAGRRATLTTSGRQRVIPQKILLLRPGKLARNRAKLQLVRT
jgi:hypothetical protein